MTDWIVAGVIESVSQKLIRAFFVIVLLVIGAFVVGYSLADKDTISPRHISTTPIEDMAE